MFQYTYIFRCINIEPPKQKSKAMLEKLSLNIVYLFRSKKKSSKNKNNMNKIQQLTNTQKKSEQNLLDLHLRLRYGR